MDANCVAAAVLALTMSPCVCTPGGSPIPPKPKTPKCLIARAQPPQFTGGARFTGGECPIITCGDNAPNAGDGLLFDEVDLSGGPNYVGLHLDTSRGVDGVTSRPLSAMLPGAAGVAARPASIEIEEGDQLAAYDTSRRRVAGSDLIGTVIRFQRDPSATGPGVQVELRVACYNDTDVKFRAGADDTIPVYDFQARLLPAAHPNDPDADWFEVCNQTALDPGGTWTSPLPALVYRGDKYVYKPPGVPGGKRVDPDNDPSSGWSFIACNGSAGSKMHLFRHTVAGGMRDVGLRTTLLKAITADYCGDGVGTFTRPGNPLAFAINGGATSIPDPYAPGTTVEAIWAPWGPVCIDRPRLRSLTELTTNPPPDGCGHPFVPCSTGAPATPTATSWTSRGYVLTANPPAP